MDYLRASIVRKLDGMSEQQARRVVVPSGTSLVSLVRHLTEAEVTWFQLRFADVAPTVPDDALDEALPITEQIRAYEMAASRNNQIVMSAESLEERCEREDYGDLTLRWVLVHMVEETARHAGHADIIREQIDGAVGR
jgi:Protein of unknown function (DUF664)